MSQTTGFSIEQEEKTVLVEDGKITAVGIGKTFIKCVTDDGIDITKICSVEVYDKFAKPAKSVIQSKSLTSVTLKAVVGALYSKDGTNWVESNEFTELETDTEYEISVRKGLRRRPGSGHDQSPIMSFAVGTLYYENYCKPSR